MESSRMKDYKPEELAEIIAPLAGIHNITSVFLFGSRATGEYSDKSDYDFLIDTNVDFTYHDYCRFADGLEEAPGTSVDIVFMSTLNDDIFSRRVLREAVRIFG